MGISWIFEIVPEAVGREHENFQTLIIMRGLDVIAIFINGVFIFVMLVCKSSVWKQLQLKLPFLRSLNGLCSTCIKKKERISNIPPHQPATGNIITATQLQLPATVITTDNDDGIEAYNMNVIIPVSDESRSEYAICPSQTKIQ